MHNDLELIQLMDSTSDSQQPTLNQSFSQLRRSSAMVNDEAFSKLRHFEMLFNEIAMAHNSDQKQIDQTISVFKEKYHKANYMINLLFDNLNLTLSV